MNCSASWELLSCAAKAVEYALLVRQKLGGADAAGRATLDGPARAFTTDRLGELGDRLVGSSSWNEWLADVVVPPPAEDLPAYPKNLDIDLEPSEPSIDSYMKVGLPAGKTTVVHIRIQKWYQPDLDRHLFQASRKIERKHGKMPLVGVFLMRPPAEGPGMTGRFEEHDAAGKVTRGFTYSSAQQEGRRRAGRDLAVRQATRRFGPDANAAATIASIAELNDLDALAQRALTAGDWPSLLARS